MTEGKRLILDENYFIDLSRKGLSEEDYLIHLVKQSRYLYLLKSEGIYHLRYKSHLDSSNYLKEMQLVNFMLTEFRLKFDESFSQRKSGDINRSLISVGQLIKLN